MAVIRWDPWGEVSALQRDVATLLGRAGVASEMQRAAFVPPIDAHRADDGALVVSAELPGVDPADVEIDVSDGVLTLAGERSDTTEVQEGSWVRRERIHGRFERSFTLPEGTDPEAIQASFDNGVLTLTIPAPPQRRPRRIAIAGQHERRDIEVTETSTAGEPVGASA